MTSVEMPTDAKTFYTQQPIIESAIPDVSITTSGGETAVTNTSESTNLQTVSNPKTFQPVFNAYLAIAEEQLSKIEWMPVQPA